MTAYMDHKNLANEVIDDARAREITDGVHRVLDRIAAAEEQAGREAGSVRLLAATKTRDIGEIMAAIDAGVRMIGENRPQEVTAKAEGLARRCAERGFSLGVAGAAPDAAAEHIPFHLIGQLQSNKIGKVLPVVDTIESVDSIDLAEKISRRAVARGITVGVLLEVNESGEESKSGCDPAHAIRIAQKIGTLDGIELRGLMDCIRLAYIRLTCIPLKNGLSELRSAGRWGAARFGAKIAGFVPETVVFLGVSPPIGGKGFRMAGVNMGVFEGETHVLVCLSIDE